MLLQVNRRLRGRDLTDKVFFFFAYSKEKDTPESLIPENLTRLFYSKEVNEPSPDRKVTKRLIFNYLSPSMTFSLKPVAE